MKKIIVVSLLVFMLILSGCACKHEVVTEANYQSPSICTECGEAIGEKVEAAFTKEGYVFSSWDTELPYVATGYDKNASGVYEEQTALVTASDFRIVDSEDGYEAKEGYEWRIATLSYTFNDPKIMTQGYRFIWGYVDYYNGYAFLDPTFTINFNGEDYECEARESVLDQHQEGDVLYAKVVSAVCVPKGYDGIVLATLSPMWHPEIGGVTPEHHINSVKNYSPLFFKMAE